MLNLQMMCIENSECRTQINFYNTTETGKHSI